MNQPVYSKNSGGIFFSPFSISIDSMEHLILINFEKDPDEFYNTFELQQAPDNDGEKRFLVIAYRNDGAADVFHQVSYPFASQATILNDVNFFERPLDHVKFEINKERLEVFFSFTDKYGRLIRVNVLENISRKNKPFFVLAPIGALSKNPASLPVYSLYDMSFTKQKSTSIEIEIDHKKHKADTFPLPIDCARNYFTRYSADTFNIDWNKRYNGPLVPLKPVNNEAAADGLTYELIDNDGHYEIKRMKSNIKNHQIIFDLTPPLPNIVCLGNKAHYNGQFMISTDKSRGKLQGEYIVDKLDNEIDLRILPNQGWIPHEKRWILKFLFMMVKVFRNWPKTYVWNAKIKLDTDNPPIMTSGWSRLS